MTTPISKSVITQFTENLSRQPKSVKVAVGVLGVTLVALAAISGYVVHQAWNEPERK